MKKLRSNSKRKWIVGGVMFFGGIGLLTTGFATWVVGTQVLSQQNNIGIKVDTADSDSVTLATKLVDAEAFNLGEQNVAAGPDTIISADEKGQPTDLEMVFDTIQIETTQTHYDSYFANNHPFKLTLKAVADLDGQHENNVVAANTVDDAANLIDKAGIASEIRTGSSWDYVDLNPITVDVTPGQDINHKPAAKEGKVTLENAVPAWNVSANIKVLTIKNLTVTFNWGSFFANMKPTEFYNDNYASLKGSISKTEAIKEELNAMKTALNGKKFYFELALVEDPIKK